MHAGYENINRGKPAQAMTTLTGAPSEVFYTKYCDSIVDRLIEGEEKGYIMTAGTGGGRPLKGPDGSDIENPDDPMHIEKFGLVHGHAYTVISVDEVEHEGKTVRLVRLRNPYGRGEWNGDWSDQSPLWTEEMKDEIEYVDKNDGMFYMSEKDFKKYYYEIAIC